MELSIVNEGGEGFCPLANAVVEGVRGGLVREKKGDVEVWLGNVANAGDYGEGVDNGKEMCLNLEVVLSYVDGDDKMRSL